MRKSREEINSESFASLRLCGKNKRPYFLYTIGLLLLVCSSFSQIKGKVIEISIKPDTSVIPGVLLFWDKTPIAVSTDANGNFEIKSSPLSNRLVIKAVGYENDTITVTDPD